jgi:hypothetical protein
MGWDWSDQQAERAAPATRGRRRVGGRRGDRFGLGRERVRMRRAAASTRSSARAGSGARSGGASCRLVTPSSASPPPCRLAARLLACDPRTIRNRLACATKRMRSERAVRAMWAIASLPSHGRRTEIPVEIRVGSTRIPHLHPLCCSRQPRTRPHGRGTQADRCKDRGGQRATNADAAAGGRATWTRSPASCASGWRAMASVTGRFTSTSGVQFLRNSLIEQREKSCEEGDLNPFAFG